MTLSTDELDWLIKRLCPDAGADALRRIEMRVQALNSTVGDMSLDLNTLAQTIGALQAQETKQMATTDQQIATIGADVQQIVTLYGALKTDDENEAAQLTALRQSLADAQAADGADSPRAKALQAIVDALAPILTPAAPAPVDATGGGTSTGGDTTVSGGTTDTTPAPVDAAPSPDTGTGTDGSAGGPAA